MDDIIFAFIYGLLLLIYVSIRIKDLDKIILLVFTVFSIVFLSAGVSALLNKKNYNKPVNNEVSFPYGVKEVRLGIDKHDYIYTPNRGFEHDPECHCFTDEE